MNVFEVVECLAAEYALARDGELELARVTGEEEIADDTDQEERDRHDRAIGEDRVGDDEREENSRNHQTARVGPDMDVFRRAPRQEGSTGRGIEFHSIFLFIYYTMIFR